MPVFPIQRRGLRIALAALAVAILAALILKPVLEHAVRTRIEAAATRQGMVARMRSVHVGVWPLLRLEGLELDLGPGAQLRADRIAVTWPLRLRLAVHSAVLAGPAGIIVDAPSTTWSVSGLVGKERELALVAPQRGLSVRRQRSASGNTWSLRADAVDIGRLAVVRRGAQPLLDGGIADGTVDLLASDDGLRFRVDLGVRGARLGGLAGGAPDDPQTGEPTDITMRFDGDWQRSRGALDVPGIRANVAGAAISGSLALRDLRTDPVIKLSLGVKQLDFAQLLSASGLEVPASLGMPAGGNADLGSASIDLTVSGLLTAPASLDVSQKISFRPPRLTPPGISRLRGDFVFNAASGSGPRHPIDVSPASPDFIALHDVPPLFIRTLLLAEDASFYGHRGIDLRELPGALLTNWTRGGAARGASTISQQLAKNLFLSREKQLGRKLQELAITLLLESALGKERILEIYLNIIEWGPDLRGLRPAAFVYFGREPKALTPAQMAFLVSIIPGPIKYQSSFAKGSPGPGLQSIINALLGKLRSVDAIGEEDYRRALGEPLVIGAGRDGLLR